AVSFHSESLSQVFRTYPQALKHDLAIFTRGSVLYPARSTCIRSQCRNRILNDPTARHSNWCVSPTGIFSPRCQFKCCQCADKIGDRAASVICRRKSRWTQRSGNGSSCTRPGQKPGSKIPLSLWRQRPRVQSPSTTDYTAWPAKRGPVGRFLAWKRLPGGIEWSACLSFTQLEGQFRHHPSGSHAGRLRADRGGLRRPGTNRQRRLRLQSAGFQSSSND